MITQIQLSGGYDDAQSQLNLPGGPVIVQHAWAIATRADSKTLFPCYGGPGGATPGDPSTHPHSPAELYTFSDIQPVKTTQVTADLDLAIICACGVKPRTPAERRPIYDTVYLPNLDHRPDHNPGPGWVQGDSSGIFYGVTGVCHQAANRILCAQNNTVVKPDTLIMVPHWSGIASWCLWGSLGWDAKIFWDNVQQINNCRPVDYQRLQELQIREHLAMSRESVKRRGIMDFFVRQGHAVQGDSRFDELQKNTSGLAERKLELDHALLKAVIAPVDFAAEVNAAARAFMDQIGAMLGPGWHPHFAPKGHDYDIVNPQWMGSAKQYSRFAHLVP